MTFLLYKEFSYHLSLCLSLYVEKLRVLREIETEWVREREREMTFIRMILRKTHICIYGMVCYVDARPRQGMPDDDDHRWTSQQDEMIAEHVEFDVCS